MGSVKYATYIITKNNKLCFNNKQYGGGHVKDQQYGGKGLVKDQQYK